MRKIETYFLNLFEILRLQKISLEHNLLDPNQSDWFAVVECFKMIYLTK